MNLEMLQSIVLAVAQERELEAVLRKVVLGLVDEAGIALARIWLIVPEVPNPIWRLHQPPDRTAYLRLMASAGKPLNSPGEDWSRLNGQYERVALGTCKIGSVGATGEPVLVSDVSVNWTTRKEFAVREQIRSFAAQPLFFRGDILGVLAVFSRAYMKEEHFLWLRIFADHAAVALANSRAFEENAILREHLEIENAYLREEVQSALPRGEIIGSSAALRKVLDQITLVAPTDATVLIHGESGTGKELVARAIHECSRRGEQQMVRVNCASVPRDLFESEFFGHSKGAFTGALRDRPGRFQLAEGGTLFLDEVGEIPLDLQSKLLRVLQDGHFERLGEDTTRRVDVRIVAATNCDLRQQVENGSFREDLYYRLSVFPIEVPPLRKRKEDIPELAEHLLALACHRLRVPKHVLTADHFDLFRDYDWPGNVRELQNVIERAVIMARDGTLGFDELFPVRRAGKNLDQEANSAAVTSPSLKQNPFLTHEASNMRDRDNLVAALKHTKGRVGGRGGAAELLGIKPTTFRSRLKARGIKYEDFR